MARLTSSRKLQLSEMHALETLSPFELKDQLIALAADPHRAGARAMLDAGRGNPNWVATTPREAFFTLGRFGIEESKRVWDDLDLGGMPQKQGIARRFRAFLGRSGKGVGTTLLRASLAYGVGKLGFDPDGFVHELADGVIGDTYPMPPRMLPHCERIVHAYLAQELCDRRPPRGRYDLFAVEGGTAAICYIFDSLIINGLLKRGDTVALATPMFTPYLEVPDLERYRFRVVPIAATELAKAGYHTWQYPDDEIDKLLDPQIKAVFFVNPGNPTAVAIRAGSMRRLVKLVKTRRPDLMLLTDDVYGTFVDHFRSLMAELPHNTIGVYSYSKYFGCTGWRLGVVAIHKRNVFDDKLAALPAATRKALNKRYGTITLQPEKLKFIDRMVADSRQVALNHTAGLSLPQQVQMALFSLFALLDSADRYKRQTQRIVRRRLRKLAHGVGLRLSDDPQRTGYYATIDLRNWAIQEYGPGAEKLLDRFHPFDPLFALAERAGIVLLNGSGFAAPDWSLRVSLANLDDDAYERIGHELRIIMAPIGELWRTEQARRSKAMKSSAEGRGGKGCSAARVNQNSSRRRA